MYWSRQYFRIILLATLVCVGSGCAKPTATEDDSLLKPEETAIASPLPRTKCTEGEKASARCIVNSSESFSYTSSFNGRNVFGNNLDGNEGSASVTVPKGFYQSKFVSVKDLDFVAANIVRGVSIFGLVGDLDATQIPDCTAEAVDSGVANATSCRFTASGKYAYQSSYGGRSQDCSIQTTLADGTTVKGQCWLRNTERLYAYEERLDYPECNLNSQAGYSCKTGPSTYLYNQAYGGRDILCPTNKVVNYKCFVKDPNFAVYSIIPCKENPEVDSAINNYACFPSIIGTWVYDVPFGGRSQNCEDNNNGNCYFQFSTKAQSSVNLTDENIKAGETIFGVMGSFITQGFYWGSGAHRDAGDKRMVYQKPPGPVPNPAPYIEAEASFGTSQTTLPTNYRFVPKIATDTEAPVAAKMVNRVGWGTTECGVDVSSDTTANRTVLEKRILNCAANATVGSGATWDGTTKGNAGQGVWKLVTRKNISGSMYEVWLDSSTDLLWSGKVSLPTGLNWCKASGNSFSTKIDEKMRENDASGICNSSTYQNNGLNHPISACTEGFAGYLASDDDSSNGFLSTGTFQNGKAGLKTVAPSLKAQGRIFWRIPTIYDYMLANHNGLRYVLPDAGPNQGAEEWTATTYSRDRSMAWTYNSTNGLRRVQPKTYNYNVRCVGR